MLVKYIYKKRIRRIIDQRYGIMTYLDKDGVAHNTSPGEWVRLDRGRPVGCIVAVGPNKVGWALCDKHDMFTKKKAREIASLRALTGFQNPVPPSIIDAFRDMEARSEKVKWNAS